MDWDDSNTDLAELGAFDLPKRRIAGIAAIAGGLGLSIISATAVAHFEFGVAVVGKATGLALAAQQLDWDLALMAGGSGAVALGLAGLRYFKK